MACRPRRACVPLDRGRPLISYNKATKDMGLGQNVWFSTSWTAVPEVTQEETTGADGGSGCEFVLRNHDIWLTRGSLQAAAGPHAPRLHTAQCLAAGHMPPGGQGLDGPADVHSEHGAESEPQSPGRRPRLFILNQLPAGCQRVRSESRLHCELLGTRTHLPSPGSPPGAGPELPHTVDIQQVTKMLSKGRKAVFPLPVTKLVSSQ